MKNTEIISKFRNLYILKIIVGYGVLFFGMAICLKFYSDVYSPKRGEIAFMFLIGLIILGIVATIDMLQENRIILREDEMIIFSYFSIKKVGIKFSDIDRIERKKIVQQSKGIQISNGYHESEIILNNGKRFVISPDKFENCKEIISIVRSKIEN